MLRRSLLTAVASAPLLAGCANTPALIADAQIIATKLQSFIPVLAEIPGVPVADTAALTSLSNYLAEAAGLASTLYPTIAPSAANTTLQNVEKAISGALGIATVPPVSVLIASAVPGLSVALQAASVLVPVLFADFGLPAPVGAAVGGMTPAQARAVLAS